MNLTRFITGLLEQGSVTLEKDLFPFDANDRIEAEAKLLRFYERDRYNMPGTVPPFDQNAALWAATYMYRTIQFMLMRDLGEKELAEHLHDFAQPRDAAAMYSADLVLRFLPDVFNLARGLSPDDPLVLRLKKTAAQFPLSSVPVEIPDDTDLQQVMEHRSLRLAYTDRIIKHKNHKRITNDEIREAVKTALGDEAGKLWPEFRLLKTEPVV